MLDETQTTIDKRVAEIIARLLPNRTHVNRLSNDEPLTAAGLDSMGMVNLLLEIEACFGISIPPRLVTPKSFRSIHSVSRLIESVAQRA